MYNKLVYLTFSVILFFVTPSYYVYAFNELSQRDLDLSGRYISEIRAFNGEIHNKSMLKTRDDIELPIKNVGDMEKFWIRGKEDSLNSLDFKLKYNGSTCYIYASVDVTKDLDINALGADLDKLVVPLIKRNFGSGPNPGIDGDNKLSILITPLFGDYDGYFDPRNMFEMPESNMREMIVLNSRNTTIGGLDINGMLRAAVHELQHMVHFAADPDEELWVMEGMSQYAEYLLTKKLVRLPWFFANPDTSLNEWGWSLESYGAVAAFFTFLGNGYSENGSMVSLVNDEKNGISGINAYLKDNKYSTTFADVFRMWTIGNVTNWRSLYDPEMDNPAIDKGMAIKFMQSNDLGTISVPTWSAEYVGFSSGDFSNRKLKAQLDPGNESIEFLYVIKGKTDEYELAIPRIVQKADGSLEVDGPKDPVNTILVIRNVGDGLPVRMPDQNKADIYFGVAVLAGMISAVARGVQN